MNQSEWFAIEEGDDELETFTGKQTKQCPLQETTNLPQQQQSSQSIMFDLLQPYESITINEDLIKYSVQLPSIITEEKKINETSRFKAYCQERDQFGNILNEQQSTQAIRILMGSSIPMIIGLRQAFLTMYEGEIAWFQISNSQLQTNNDKNQIQKITKYYKIQIQDVIQKMQSANVQTIENWMHQLEQFRIEGNQLYDRKEFVGAASKYQRGINFADKQPKKFQEDNEIVINTNKITSILKCNKAQAIIKQNKFEEARNILIELITKEEINNQFDTNILFKIYYRLIQCELQLNNKNEVLKYFDKLKQLNNVEDTFLNQLEKEIENYK